MMKDQTRILIPDYSNVPMLEPIRLKEHQWHDGVMVRVPNWLGDAVMAIPALTQIKTVLPPFCGLFVLAPKGFAALFEAMPEVVDRVIPLENAHAFPTSRERLGMRRLQAGVGILFNNSFRDALILRMAGVRRLYGAHARFRGWLLSRGFSFPKRRTAELNSPHQAAKYMAMAEAFGAEKWNGVFPEIQDLVTAETLPPEQEKVLAGPRILAVAAGAAYGAAKRWPAESFREVCRRWIGEGGTVIALGSKSEYSIGEEVLRDLPRDRAFNLSGKTSLTELIHILKSSEKCLANDSGVMHLAAALGLPGVAPFGPTDPVATGPVSHQWKMVFEKIPCSPCFKRVCPFGTKACFNSVTPDAVWNALISD